MDFGRVLGTNTKDERPRTVLKHSEVDWSGGRGGVGQLRGQGPRDIH